MKYGTFDKAKREYVITRPDTPAPWANYLGSPDYGAIITNQAGGYSFAKSGAKGRILRYRFNSDDTPGRYIYMRDDETGVFWSASWQPVGRRDDFETVCRHGLGYTVFDTVSSGITSGTTFYVPLDTTCEVWHHRMKNDTDRERSLSVFGYAEFTNEPDFEKDQVDLQYSLFISRTDYQNGAVIQTLKEHDPEARRRFFAQAGKEVTSHTGDKEHFLGLYRSYDAPRAVEKGSCDNSLNTSLNSCGALHTKLRLSPGEEVSITYLLGEGDGERAESLRRRYGDPVAVSEDLEELRDHWEARLSGFQVRTPNAAFDSMINTWNAFQCFTTFIWSRAASLIYCGHRNGFGYRDTVQDIQGIIHLAPELARKQLIFMLSAQVSSGAGLPLVKFTHDPGHEDTPDDLSYVQETGHPSYRADDALWLFPTVKKYIGETGDTDLLHEVAPYADRGEATVYGHLKQAIRFSLEHSGKHGLPAGLHADWNDCLRLGRNGESVFVAQQLFLALSIMEDLALRCGDGDYRSFLVKTRYDLKDRIESLCFEKDRYIRGITEEGLRIGSLKNREAAFWLNPQSWSVLSGLADQSRGEKLLDKVHEELATPWGACLMAPPFSGPAFEGALATVYNQSVKENGSIFLQTQGWLILAEALLGRGDRAYEYYRASCPAWQNEDAELRRMEPYVYGQFTEGPLSPSHGRSHVHWLTGTASTVMVAAVEGILGMRPEPEGLRIDPAIPAGWDEVLIEKRFRGKELTITIENREGRQSGVREIWLNGERLEAPLILEEQLKSSNTIRCIL